MAAGITFVAAAGNSTVDTSTFSDNTATYMAAIWALGPLTLDASTVSGNTADAGVVAFGEPRHLERATLDGRAAPFTFPDLEGRPRSLEEWRGRKPVAVRP